MSTEGASQNQRMLYAAREDDTALLEEILSQPGSFDVNYQDGLGNTALHYAASAPAPDTLEMLLEHEGTDVDLQNRIEGDTPLHMACQLSHPEARKHMVSSLLDAGADPRIRNKSHTLPIDLLRSDETELRQRIKVAEAELAIDQSQIAGAAQDSDSDSDEADGGGHSGEE